MRLIDADKLHYKRVLLNDCTQSAVVVFAKEIDKAKKIKAIPIEWIKEELDYARKMYNNSTELTEPYWRGNVSALEVLIIRWEKENADSY